MPRIAIAVGSSIATVAVLETKADSTQVIAPKATTVRSVLLPTPGSASTRNANRRASPWRSIAWAMMNAPMKTRIVVEPNGATTSSAGATPITTISTIPSRPPIGIGIASEIHSTITNSSAAASRCCVESMSSGSSRNTRKTSGARNSPIVRRAFSKRSSAGLSFCSPRVRYVPTWAIRSSASP